MNTEIFTKILALYPEFNKVYGPYTQPRNDNRSIICLRGPNEMRRTISWPKAMMEAKLGRLLTRDEFVDHIDDNPTNNQYDNFQLLTCQDNNIKSLVARGATAKIEKFTCPMCGKLFEKELYVVRHNQHVQKKAGPFCGKSCAGKYGDKVSNNAGGRPRAISDNMILETKALRKSGLSVKEVAKIIGIHETSASRIINGHLDHFLSARGEAETQR